MLVCFSIDLDHRTTLRVLGITIITVLVLGIGLFQTYGGKSIVETLYEIFILIIGGLGVIAIQLMVWPERFLPKSAQLTNPPMTTIDQKPIENLRPLSEGEIFESEVLPHQKIFHRGDPVLFRARFKGKLTHGYLATHIKKRDETFAGAFDYTTLANPATGKGKLNGEVNLESRWSWAIPTDCKTGPCGFFIYAANHFPISSLWVRIKVWGLHALSPHRTDLAKATNMAIVGNWETVEVV